MKVSELIRHLQVVDPELPVVIRKEGVELYPINIALPIQLGPVDGGPGPIKRMFIIDSFSSTRTNSINTDINYEASLLTLKSLINDLIQVEPPSLPPAS